MNEKILLSLDIETKSITEDKDDALNPFKSEITCIGVYGQDGNFAKVYRTPWNDFKKEIIDNDIYSFVAHNGKFDFKHLALNLGIRINPERWVDDTRYMAFVCTEKIEDEWLNEYESIRKELNKSRKNSHREARYHSLKTLAPYFLGVDAFWEPDESHDSDEYVLKDCEYTYRLYKLFTEKLAALDQYEFYKTKLMPWSRMILEAEIEGVVCDKDAIVSLQDTSLKRIQELSIQIESKWKPHYDAYYSKLLLELEQEYNEMCTRAINKNPDKRDAAIVRYSNLLEKAKIRLAASGELKLNLDSPAQLKWLLRDRIGLNIVNLEGDESTDKEVLNRLALENADIKLLLELKKLTKLTTSFLPKYLELMTSENKLHCNFNIDGTRTGRLSSSSVNLQQVPRENKDLFIAKDGYKFITYDVQSIEPVLMAYYTEDKALVDIVLNNRNFHSINTIEMFNLDCPEDEVKTKYKFYRDAAKEISLATLYGSGWNQVRISCLKRGIIKTEFECKEIVNRIRNKYSGVWDFKKALDKELEKGEVLFNLLGRPLKIPDPDDVYMRGFNTLIQSSASDLVLDIAEDIYKQTEAKPIMFIHDSVVFEVDENKVENVDKMINNKFRRELTNSNFSYRLNVEGGISNVWE